MPQDIAMLQILNQTGNGWLTSVLLLGLLLALLFKQQRVYNWTLFRVSCWLLAASIIIPPTLNVFMNLTNGSGMPVTGSGMFGRTSANYEVICIFALGPILLGISIISGLFAMIPRDYRQPLTPPKHPLE
jgi:hypothetical protein